MADLDEAVRALPGNALVLRTRGVAKAEAQKRDEARADFDKSIAADPKPALTRQIKAEARKGREMGRGPGRFDKAIATEAQTGVELRNQGRGAAQGQKAAGSLGHPGKGPRRLCPTTSTCCWAKGRIWVAQANYKAAAEELTRRRPSTRIEPPRSWNCGRLSTSNWARRPRPSPTLTRSCSFKPGQAKMIRLRAVLLADLGKYDVAAEELQELHKAESERFITLLQLGTRYMGMKKYDKAIEVFNYDPGGLPRRRSRQARPGRRQLEPGPPRQGPCRNTNGP